jgi:hypothetical protein
MRGRYVVLVMLIVGVWWMHRATTDAGAVATVATPATATTKQPVPSAHRVAVLTPRPELPAEPPPELPPLDRVDEPFPMIVIDEPAPPVNADIDGRGIEGPPPIDIDEPFQLDEVNEHPLIRYNDPEIDWD